MNDPRYRALVERQMHESEGTPKETRPLLSDYIIGWGVDSGAVFIRHTSELMFKITPFQKDGDEYFKLTQFGDDKEIVKDLYLCIGEMEGLHELLSELIKTQRARDEIRKGGA